MKILKAVIIGGGILIAACVVLALIAAPNMPKTIQQQAAKPQPAQVEPTAQPALVAEKPAEAQPTTAPLDLPTQPPPAASPIVLTGKLIKCKPSILYKAKADTQLVGIAVTIKNNGTDEVNINPLYFQLIDGDGFVYRAELASCDGQIDTTKLSPGTAIRGELGFEIPKGAKPASLKMATDPFEQNSVSIPIE